MLDNALDWLCFRVLGPFEDRVLFPFFDWLDDALPDWVTPLIPAIVWLVWIAVSFPVAALVVTLVARYT